MSDIHVLIGIKLLFVGGIVLAGLLWWKWRVPSVFLALFGLASGGAYALFSLPQVVLLWGLQGDEVTLGAMFQVFTSYEGFVDFAYHSLPAFYPPLYFWVFGMFGKLFGWNGITVAKVATTVVYVFFPITVYWAGRLLEKMHTQALKIKTPSVILFFAIPLFMSIVIEQDIFIGKPYEIITCILTILWCVSLYILARSTVWKWWYTLVYGCIAGLIAITYYLWLVFAAIAFVLLLIDISSWRVRGQYLLRLLGTAGVTLVVASPFWLPLVMSYMSLGMENAQTAYFTPNGLSLWLPFVQSLSIQHLLFLGGFVSLIVYRKHTYIRPLIALFATAFLWWIGGLVSLLVFNTPFQEFRGFYLFAPTVLCIAAAYGLQDIYQQKRIKDVWLQIVIPIMGLLIVAAYSMFGIFIDDASIRERFLANKLYPTSQLFDLRTFFLSEPYDPDMITLHTMPQLMSMVPLNSFIYFNQHNSHPAALFTKRYMFLELLASQEDSDSFEQALDSSPYGAIDQFIFYTQDDLYYLFFHIDAPIQGFEERSLTFRPDLFSTETFDTVYERNGYIVLRRKDAPPLVSSP